MFRFELTKECGDATCWYKLLFDKPYTIREFITDVLATRDMEWGKFSVIDKTPDKKYTIFGDVICEYNRGGLRTMKASDARLDKPIIFAKANGGWGNMDYILYCLPDICDLEDFVRVYSKDNFLDLENFFAKHTQGQSDIFAYGLRLCEAVRREDIDRSVYAVAEDKYLHVWLNYVHPETYTTHIDTQAAIYRGEENIHTTQTHFLHFRYGYRLFVHVVEDDIEGHEITLGECSGTNRLIKEGNNIEHLLIAGEFSWCDWSKIFPEYEKAYNEGKSPVIEKLKELRGEE